MRPARCFTKWCGTNRRPFANVARTATADWIWNIDGVGRVLYRLPELLKYPDASVFVCEGEKDADRVASLDHCATAVACGNWTNDCVQALAGRDVLIFEDNDEPGRKKALEAAQVLQGSAKTIRIVRLPNLPDKGDVSDWLDADPSRGAKLADVCFDAPLWTPVSAEAAAATGDSILGAAKALPFIDMSRWDTEPAPSREWAAENRIPLKQPYLFTGHGAVGKSLVELMRACAHALNKFWLGMPVAQGPVIYMGAEDDADELHRRLEDILSYYGASFADAIAGGLHLLSYMGEDCMLGIPDRSGIIRATPLFQQLEQAAMDIKPVAVMLDTVSDVFSGSEIDRGHVTQFIKMIQGMAFRAECSMSILAHPSNAGMATGTGLSGSTGWHNRVRARAYMKALETPKGEEPDPDLREIQFLKNNYGRQGDSIQVRWQRGVYVLEGAPSSLEKLAQDQRDDERFVELLQRYDSQGRKVSDSKTANNYAPKQFAEEKGPDGKSCPQSGSSRPCNAFSPPPKSTSKSMGDPRVPTNALPLAPSKPQPIEEEMKACCPRAAPRVAPVLPPCCPSVSPPSYPRAADTGCTLHALHPAPAVRSWLSSFLPTDEAPSGWHPKLTFKRPFEIPTKTIRCLRTVVGLWKAVICGRSYSRLCLCITSGLLESPCESTRSGISGIRGNAGG